MDINIKKIVNAWLTSFNPTKEEKKLAEKRYDICFGCDQRASLLKIEHCKACGSHYPRKYFPLLQEILALKVSGMN